MKMQLFYCTSVGELIWAMTITRPNLAFASVKLSQANLCPEEVHYHAIKHALKYLYSTRDEGIYTGKLPHTPNSIKAQAHQSTAISRTSS
jgi:hypothetical protein